MGTILDLFKEYDFKKSPEQDDRFIVLEPDEKGVRYCSQVKISNPINGVFTSCTIRWFPSGEKNVSFKNDNPQSVKSSDVAVLVNEMFKNLGADDTRSGLFDESDRKGLMSGFWLGRNYNSQKPSFSFYMHGDEFNLTIALGKEFSISS